MAPRETYDPEDIESLLSERSFDELLAEERAFVLRHLSDREEYERMRELLLRVRQEEGTAASEVLQPDGSVREHVLRAFRSERASTWRIWLNSVQAFLIPREASAMWRPLLAVATVALLVTFGVVAFQRVGRAPKPELAEARQPVSSMARPDGAAEPATTDMAAAADSAKALFQAERATDRRSGDLSQPSEIWSPMVELNEAPLPVAEAVVALDRTDGAKAEDENESEVAAGLAQEEQAGSVAPAVNYVEKDQLAANQSVVNATGEVTMKELATVETVSRQRKETRKRELAETEAVADSRSLAQDDQLLELLNAAW